MFGMKTRIRESQKANRKTKKEKRQKDAYYLKEIVKRLFLVYWFNASFFVSNCVLQFSDQM